MFRTLNVAAILSLKLRTRARWSAVDHPQYHYEAYVGPKRWNIRINDFPDENMFTLFVNDKPVLDFNRWPHKHWADEPVEALAKIAESKGY